MTLISCPVCEKSVSSQASACPNCGHPIAASTAEPQKIVIEQKAKKGGRGWLLLVILLIAIGVAAASTKPSEMTLKNAVSDKYGPLVVIGAELGKAAGLLDYTYHDYIFFSTLTVQLRGGEEQRVAIGCFNQVMVADAK